MAYTKNVTKLKGFLGLSTYYRRYIKGLSQFAAPLTDLTKKGAFTWIEVAHQSFEKMKTIMSSCLDLALPNYSLLFIVECDVSGEGLGTVLMQNHHSIPFEIRKLKDYEHHFSIYNKDMLAILHALTKLG